MVALDRGSGLVRRRNGEVVPFDRARIDEAVLGACREAGRADAQLGRHVTGDVVATLARRRRRGPVAVEETQDAVEHVLMERGLDEVARVYVLYRRQRARLRDAKRMLGVRDELKLGLNAAVILRERYLLRDERGRPAESAAEMMARVGHHVAAAEDAFVSGSAERWSEEFAGMLKRLDFLPHSPTLMNAGTRLGLLSGCVVLPVEDSLESIFAAIGQTALVHQAGGGTGFSFSRLRPAGDVVASTHGAASGPVSFMRIFDVATEVVKQGGRRRGANMAVLDVSHPDVREFATAKREPGSLENFNLSVAVNDRFMRAAAAGGSHRLVNPRTGRAVANVPARELFELIVEAAWQSGDPGLLFLDRVNRANPLRGLGRIEATNPCGEVPLLPYESCNLGSLNLSRFVAAGRVDWQRLDETVQLAVRFLDDVIDVNRYPFLELERASRAARKVRLGFMGLAELLASLGIPYDSEDALRLASRIAARVRTSARFASAELARERGTFPAFEQSTLRRGVPLRNAQLMAVAPTGTISIIAGTTSGIEPRSPSRTRETCSARSCSSSTLCSSASRGRAASTPTSSCPRSPRPEPCARTRASRATCGWRSSPRLRLRRGGTCACRPPCSATSTAESPRLSTCLPLRRRATSHASTWTRGAPVRRESPSTATAAAPLRC
ncbi:MAG TPA: adenosylcobalamin-dependent ribonucleoside-diphosphate reductase [Gaiellaceae bacterium]|nr:adenosylcobalamin-dependent ribonucleoside-diphosphate reductase [Gaiellaceae bacterium]